MIITMKHNYNDSHRYYYYTFYLQMLNIYESGKGVLKVGPYSWEPWEDAAKWITFPDRFIRKVSVLPTSELVYVNFYSSLISGNCSALSIIESFTCGLKIQNVVKSTVKN